MPTRLIGVTGHQYMPAVAALFVSAAIAEHLRRIDENIIGFSSLAEGADQMFAEAVLRVGGSLHVIIPCSNYIAAFKNQKASENFQKLQGNAVFSEVLGYDRPSEEAFLAAGRRIVDLAETIIAAWDGKEALGKGGTGDIVAYARQKGKDVHVIWPAGVTRSGSG